MGFKKGIETTAPLFFQALEVSDYSDFDESVHRVLKASKDYFYKGNNFNAEIQREPLFFRLSVGNRRRQSGRVYEKRASHLLTLSTPSAPPAGGEGWGKGGETSHALQMNQRLMSNCLDRQRNS
jgi:hypothetical protein